MPDNNTALIASITAVKNAEIERRFLVADENGPLNFKVVRVTPSIGTPHNAIIEVDIDQFPDTPLGVTVANRYLRHSVKAFRVDLVEAAREAGLAETAPSSRTFTVTSGATSEGVLTALGAAGLAVLEEEVIVSFQGSTKAVVRAKPDSVGFVGSVTLALEARVTQG